MSLLVWLSEWGMAAVGLPVALAVLALKSTLVLLLAGGAAAMARRISFRAAHHVWAAGLALVLLAHLTYPLAAGLPLLPSGWGSGAGLGLDSAPRAPAGGGARARFDAAVGARPATGIDDLDVRLSWRDPHQTLSAATRPAPLDSGPPTASSARTWGMSLSVLWALGFLLLAARLVFYLLALGWIRAIGREPTGAAPSRGRLEALLSALPGAGAVHVTVSSRVRTPLAAGLLHPGILLPLEARDWDEGQLDLVLRHELEHCRHRDPAVAALAELVCALQWFNPLVWWAARETREVAELASDQAVLSQGTDPLRYAEELVQLARTLQAPPLLGTSGLAQRRALRRRVRALLEGGGAMSTARRPIAAVTLTAAAMAVPLLAVRPVARSVPAPELSPGSARALEALASSERGERLRAAWTLGEREDRNAVHGLIEALSDADGQVRALAAWALGEIKDPAALPALAAAAADPDALTREMVALALGEIESAEALPALSELVDDPHSAVRAAALWGLGEIATARALERVYGALDDPDPEVRRTALEVAVRDRRTPLRRLVAALHDPAPEVRATVARGLGSRGDPAAVEPLIEALRDPERRVRQAAVWALDEINPGRRPPS